jgi:alkylation response protein AidB-like acyl-CoA dehydrogenase
MLTDEQNMIAGMAESFAADRLRPHAARWDEEGNLDRPTLEALAELGFAGIYVAEDLGGSGLGRLDAALVFEKLSMGCVSHASFMSIHNMATWMIATYGDDAMQRKWVPRLAAGELIASYCLTEPSAGSDAASLRTRAERRGDEYVLNGAKAFISGGGFSDVYLVMARTSDDGARGVSAFIVEKDAPGLSFGKPETKMGWRAQPTSMVNFDDCRIPAENRIGPEGEGFRYAMAGLDGGRLNIAACSLGGAQEAFDRALAYVQERKQFGRPVMLGHCELFELTLGGDSLADVAGDRYDSTGLVLERDVLPQDLDRDLGPVTATTNQVDRPGGHLAVVQRSDPFAQLALGDVDLEVER